MDTTERPIGPEAIAAYYDRRYGKPAEEKTFRTQTHSFSVLTFSPDQTGEGVFLFTTIGASQILGTAQHSCEFFFGLTGAPRGLADSLAEIALDGNGTGGVPQFGDTTTLAFELWEGTTARSYLFTDGGEEIIPPLSSKGAVIDFVQLVPVFPGELELKKAEGEAALWEVFQEKEVAYWDACRPPAL